MTLIATLAGRAALHGERTAIIEAGGASITFAGLMRASQDCASALRARGIAKGDRVLVALPLGIGLYVSLAALWRLGAVVVFPEPALGLAGLRHAAATARPRALFAGRLLRAARLIWRETRAIPLALPPGSGGSGAAFADAPVALDDPALMSFTSGSTGEPKCIIRSHAFLLAQNAALEPLLAPGADNARDLVAFPVFVLATLALGATAVLPNWNLRKPQEAKAASILAHLERHRVTRLLVPPAICAALSRQPLPARLTYIFTGGGPVFPAVLRALMHVAPQAHLVAVYGSTEAEPIAHLHAQDIAQDDWRAMAGAGGLLAGAPVAAVRLRIIDDEILVTGAHVNKAYADPAQDAAAKVVIAGEVWHRTGDAGRLDAQGRLWLLGRIEARVGGLFPFCVETAARQWPGVRAAALAALDGRPVLALEGDAAHLPAWRVAATGLGITRVRRLRALPLDRRHRSKIDYRQLQVLLRRSAQAQDETI